jgi:hypothetical protein
VSNAANHRASNDCTSLGVSNRCVGSNGDSTPETEELVVIERLAGLAHCVVELVVTDQMCSGCISMRKLVQTWKLYRTAWYTGVQ